MSLVHYMQGAQKYAQYSENKHKLTSLYSHETLKSWENFYNMHGFSDFLKTFLLTASSFFSSTPLCKLNDARYAVCSILCVVVAVSSHIVAFIPFIEEGCVSETFLFSVQRLSTLHSGWANCVAIKKKTTREQVLVL